MKSEEQKLEKKDSIIYQTNENCQVFNGPISGCVFAMPGAHVNQNQHIHMSAQTAETTQGDEGGEDANADKDMEAGEQPCTEPLNLFAPKKQLQQLLRQAWFAEVRSSGRYDARWTDGFVEALMQSEHGEGIARQWAVTGQREKKTQLKGYIVGLLKDAGVIRGSNDEIARKVGIAENPRTFSRYMGNGRKQPYAEWVREWINGAVLAL